MEMVISLAGLYLGIGLFGFFHLDAQSMQTITLMEFLLIIVFITLGDVGRDGI